MKKLLLALVAVLCSVAVSSAADLYLRGDVNGWGATAAYKFQTTDNDTYTLDVAELSGSFKIADASWGTHNYGGSNNSKIDLDKEYQCSYNGSNLSLSGSGKASNVTLTFVLSTQKLTISGQAQENNYDKLYIIGDINGSGWNGNRTDYPMEKVAGNDEKFSAELTVTAKSYLKFNAGTWTYGPGATVGADVALADGYTGAIKYPGGDKSYVLEPGSYTFTIDLKKGAEEGNLSVVGQGTGPVYPETLYIVGNLPGAEWQPTTALALTKTDDGMFEITTTLEGAAQFKFITQQGAWGSVGTEYGPATSDDSKDFLTVSIANPITLSAGSAYSFKLQEGPGKYKFAVNLKDNTVTVTGEGGPVYPDALYMLGTLSTGAWDPAAGATLAKTGTDGVYEGKAIELVNDATMAKAYFSFCTRLSSDWSNIGTRYGADTDGLAVTPGIPAALTVGENAFTTVAGKYDVQVSLVDMTVTLTAVGGGEFSATTVYMIGTMVDGSWNETTTDYAMTNSEAAPKTWTGEVTLLGAPTNFRLKMANGSVGGPASGDVTLDAEATVAIAVPAGENASYAIMPGKYTMTVTEADGAYTLSVKRTADAFPEKMYVVGTYKKDGFKAWTPETPFELTTQEPGIYISDDIYLIMAEGTDAYFQFLQLPGSWDHTGARYGASSTDEPIAMAQTKTVVPAGGATRSFKTSANHYMITLNLKTLTVTLDTATGVDFTEADSQTIVNVYNIQGVELMHAVKAADAIATLPGGMYIIGGKKVMIVK